jgi:hypothetical protein
LLLDFGFGVSVSVGVGVGVGFPLLLFFLSFFIDANR